MTLLAVLLEFPSTANIQASNPDFFSTLLNALLRLAGATLLSAWFYTAIFAAIALYVLGRAIGRDSDFQHAHF